MKLRFTKMHGIGNDFIVIDAFSQPIQLGAEQIRQLADRHFGVGFDQLLMVEPSQLPGIDFRYRIFNADGGEVEQCGNGARCFVRFVHEKALSQKREIQVETARGVITLTLEENNLVRVNMGPPEFAPVKIPFTATQRETTYPLEVAGQIYAISAISMGNPHAVQVVENVDTAPVSVVGPAIESHVRFPQRVNAGFMEIQSPNAIRLRVYERGSGETLACGSGACAAVVAGIQRGLLQSPVTVSMRGGQLNIRWDGEGQPVWMSGPAESVFEGEIIVN